MAYLLDTDIISNRMRPRPNPTLEAKIASVPQVNQFTSAITLGELLYGAVRRDRTDLLEHIRRFTDVLPVIPFDEQAARIFGPLKADLERKGTPLAEADLRIAAITLANRLTLVTGNVRHFGRVPGLTLENWLADS